MNGSRQLSRGEWFAWGGWLLLFIVTAAIMAGGSLRTVVPAYRLGADGWLSGQNMYDGRGTGGFVYFPQAAILFVPFALLPPLAGEILWRLAIIALFVGGLRSLARLSGNGEWRSLFPIMTLVALPLAWDCARNGQATLAMTGLMLLAMDDLEAGRRWRAVFWLGLSVAVKPLSLVLIMLIMAIEWTMIWRLALGMLAGALSPFLFQHPQYVMQQYVACIQNMTTAAHIGVAAHGWTSPFTGLRALTGIDVPEQIQTVIRLSGAVATLFLCRIAWRRHATHTRALFVFSLSVLYLMLFSPRTENNTYAMLGAVIAAFLARAWHGRKASVEAALLGGMVIALLGSRAIERLLAPHAEQVWLSPLMAIIFSVHVVVRLFADAPKPGHQATSS